MDFYAGHNITRKLLCSLMDFLADIKIAKYTISISGVPTQNKLYQVPVMWGSTNKWLQIARNSTARKPGLSDNELSNRPIEIDRMLPRIGVMMTGMMYDTTRHIGKAQKIRDYASVSLLNEDNVYAPVPYNIDVDVSIIAKNLNEVLQIVEQILPYFSPSLSLDIKVLEDRPSESVTIALVSVSPDIVDEISELEERLFSFNLGFLIKGNYYLPKQNNSLIRNVEVTINDTSDDNFNVYLNEFNI